MISFYKLEQIIKIWMESIKTDKEVWYKTVGGGVDDGYSQTYELSPPSETHPPIEDVRFVFIHTITDSTIKNAKEFRICLDSIDNPVFVITKSGLHWQDNVATFGSKSFSNANINKLRSMLIDADKIIEDYLKEHPKFDMDENHGIIITDIIFKEPERIEIRFASNNRIFNRNNKLYVGFDSTDEDGREWNYVFKVTEKHISVFHSYSGTNVFTTIPFKDYAYTAVFHGYFRPTEEAILNATFRWVISKEIIKQANKEACYT